MTELKSRLSKPYKDAICTLGGARFAQSRFAFEECKLRLSKIGLETIIPKRHFR